MKAAGHLIKVDALGRIVIPKKLREKFDLEKDSPLELFTEDDMIILKKYHSCCVFCKDDDNVVEYKGKYICQNCLAELVNEG